MKKFLRTLLLFVLVVGVITAAVNGLYIYRVNSNCDTMGDGRNNNSAIKNVPENIQICNLGSSHGLFGFNYEDVCDEYVCFNFGQPSQTLSYDYRILQFYINNFDDGAIVLIPVSHFSLFGKPETEYDNFAALNKRYYKFLPDELIKEYDAKTDFFVNYAPALAADDLPSLIKTLFLNNQDKGWANTISAEAVDDNALNRYRTFVESKLDANGNRRYNSEEIDALYAIIRLCKEHNLTPVLVTTPYLSEYNNAVRGNDPEFYDDFYGVLDEVTEKTGAVYLDYSEDSRFSNEYSMFMDVDHLNIYGSREFTNTIISELMNDN